MPANGCRRKGKAYLGGKEVGGKFQGSSRCIHWGIEQRLERRLNGKPLTRLTGKQAAEVVPPAVACASATLLASSRRVRSVFDTHPDYLVSMKFAVFFRAFRIYCTSGSACVAARRSRGSSRMTK
ncbi:hypothetical protein cyc_06649 [Cyclospora cayetanensis]|uniref:Uncharacterized protein n=1 Tax=Cyclospora cayetanensis TaxID=88456 RepID=A0A1D3D447_9EIME|nr:hypothetical protein cyc_06649 [Cyclospora cayetanensis]